MIPGLVDIHTHGAIGEDFSDGKPGGMQVLADYYAAATAPAKAAGLTDVGSIEVGKCADFTVPDENLSLRAVFIDGVQMI